MNENFLENQLDISKKSKIKIFYNSNKKIIIISFILIIILGFTASVFFDYKKKEKIKISENNINAKILLENKKQDEALKLLKDLIFINDKTYSSLSLFMIINENLIEDTTELNILINHLLSNNNYDTEIKNLLIFKKALLNAEIINESDLLDSLLPIINSNSLWKIHALLLIGDFYVSNSEYTKAKEFYAQILSIKNLNDDVYRAVRSKLEITAND